MAFFRSPVVSLCFSAASGLAAVLTHHNDNARTGANLQETILSTSNVNTNQFGMVVTGAVDDQIYAQPLVMTNVNLPGYGVHNLVIVATVADSVYALDADDPTAGVPYWQVSFLGPSVIPVRNTDMNDSCYGDYRDFSGNIGIVGTPVIDPATLTLYVVARTRENGTNFVQRLHALDITTGAERSNSPVVITATYPGAGDGNIAGVLTFDPLRHNQRSGLALINGVVYIAWASHCDWDPYHGWLIGYDATNLQQVVVYNDTPNGGEGGIWMSGQAPAADSDGNIYLVTGNGAVDTSGTINRAQSFLKLTRQGAALSVASWFTPYNWSDLNARDTDLGAAGLLLIPGTRLAFSGGKQGVAYLVDRDNMGGLSGSITADTNIAQSFVVTNELHGGPVWWDGPDGSYAYLWPASGRLQQYKFDRNAGWFLLPAYAQGTVPGPQGLPGGTLAISANGTNAGSGILWASHQLTGDANASVRPGILRAYDAQNVAVELWNSEQFSARDAVGNYAKFVPPTVANGKVYLATFSKRLNVYGLLHPPTAPQILQEPRSASRYAGQTVAFSVRADGSQPLSFQWQRAGSPIAGATNSFFVLASVQTSDAGSYTCRITNNLGATNTLGASLSVVPTPSTPYSQAVLRDNPIAYWRLGELAGTVAHDFVGGFDGQFLNVALGLPGYNALDTDTAAGLGTLSTSNCAVTDIPLDFAAAVNGQFSVEVWVKGGPQPGEQGIITKGSGGEFALDTGSVNQGFRFYVRDADENAHLANGSLGPNGNWRHLVGVCDQSNGVVRLYVDGVANASASIPPGEGIWFAADALAIGSVQSLLGGPFDHIFIGAVDEAAVYDYALTPNQVLDHFIAGTNLFPVALSVSYSNRQMVLSWPTGTLQSAGSVSGPYTNISGAVSPYALSPTAPSSYFRVRVR